MKYQHEIDCIRGIAAITVVLRHTLVLAYADFGLLEDYWFQCLTLFAVPVFFFLSGFSLTLRYKESLNLRSFYKKRFRYLLPAYAIWVFLLYFFISYENLIFLNDANNNKITPFHEFIISYFLILITGNILTLWFLYVIFQYYLIYPFLLKFYKILNSNMKKLILIIFFVSTFFIYYIGNEISNIFFLEYQNYVFLGDYKVNIAYSFFFIPFFIYFFLGISIGFNWDSLKNYFREKKYLRNIIYFLFILSLLSLPYILNILNPRQSHIYPYFTIWILLFSVISIFFFLLIFQQKKVYLVSQAPLSDSLILNFEGKYFGLISKRLWIIGQFSTALFLTQRVILFLLIKLVSAFHLFKFIQTIAKNPSIGLFLISAILFILAILICLILTKLVWEMPYGYYIIGKKSDWINIENQVLNKNNHQ